MYAPTIKGSQAYELTLFPLLTLLFKLSDKIKSPLSVRSYLVVFPFEFSIDQNCAKLPSKMA